MIEPTAAAAHPALPGGAPVPDPAAVDLDTRCVAITEEITCLEGLTALLTEIVGEVVQAGGTPEADRLVALGKQLAAAYSSLRQLRERMQDASDRLQAAHSPSDSRMEAVRSTVECVVHDHLEPALAALQTLRDQLAPGVPA
jgi:hypothetical protein